MNDCRMQLFREMTLTPDVEWIVLTKRLERCSRDDSIRDPSRPFSE